MLMSDTNSNGGRPETNVEFITRMMNTSGHGALMQAFVLTALEEYSRAVAQQRPADMNSPVINGEAWHDCAVELLVGICRHLGVPVRREEEQGEAPARRKAAAKSRAPEPRRTGRAAASRTGTSERKAEGRGRGGAKARGKAAPAKAPQGSPRGKAEAPKGKAPAAPTPKAPEPKGNGNGKGNNGRKAAAKAAKPDPVVSRKAETDALERNRLLSPKHEVVRWADSKGSHAKCACGWIAHEGPGMSAVIEGRITSHMHRVAEAKAVEEKKVPAAPAPLGKAATPAPKAAPAAKAPAPAANGKAAPLPVAPNGIARMAYALRHSSMGVLIGFDRRGKPQFAKRLPNNGMLFESEDKLMETFVKLPDSIAMGCDQVGPIAPGSLATWGK